MTARFAPQTFELYQHWPLDCKPSFNADDEVNSVLDEKILDSNTPTDLSLSSDPRKGSFDHLAHPFARTNMWQDYPADMAPHHLHPHTHPSMPLPEPGHHPIMRIEVPQATMYPHPPCWPNARQSGSNTPTPIYENVQQEYDSALSMSYHNGPMNFNQVPYHPDPISATPMSPQSSQGGWMSAASSDSTEHRKHPARSPGGRATSPTAHTRPDGIRKKNARFEIPAERNLSNIDSLILGANDEHEKKELKQQKRLLRNRQAALDSRQRKKMHTEKLEQEKRKFDQVITDLEEDAVRARETLQLERDQWMHERQRYDHYIHNLEYERDEAFRTKTLETAELRKMNNILKDHIREFERHETATQHSASGTFSTDFSSFDGLGMEVYSWEDNFDLVNNNDFKMETSEQPQVTPTPAIKVTETKSDMPFSWNAFYMCLLFGAFIASKSSGATSMQPSIPALSEEYRAESANVLKAVLASESDSTQFLVSASKAMVGAPATISGNEMVRTTSGTGDSAARGDRLSKLHTALTTPTRNQHDAAAFSLSASTYDHLTNPDHVVTATSQPEKFESKPSRLQTAFESMQEARQDVDRVIRGGVHERSMLWERIPEKVLRDFRRMVEQVESKSGGDEL